jgi:N-acetylneuraminic acid mutarotase
MTKMQFESLEKRTLLHADFSAAINFQPAGTPRAPGMLMDYGSAFDYRRGGYEYGWTPDRTGNAVDRNVTRVQRNDTYMVALLGDKWEITVPDGEYQVYVVAGEPKSVNERMGVLVEGEITVSGVTKSARRYLEGSKTVNVTDGRISIEVAPWVAYNKLTYLAIQSTHTTPDVSTLRIEASAPNATEAGLVPGRFTITRTGSLDQPVTIPLTVGGTATNGVDYGVIGSQVTLGAGVASIDLAVSPAADALVEGTETVIVSLGAVSGYTIADASATVQISDNPPQLGSLSWSTGSSRPLAASEIIAAEVGGVMYTFGGYIDNTFKPTKKAYKYTAGSGWSAIADLPEGLTHPGIAASNDTIYFAGGYPGTGTNGNQVFSTTKVFSYSPTTNSYTNLPSLPVARGGGALAILDNKLYFISGSNSSRNDVTNVYMLDLANQGAGWVSRAPLPAARNHAAAVTLNGSIYVIGGQTGQDAALTAHGSLYRYNASNDTWTTLASMSTPRSHISDATFVYQGRIVVLAGQNAYESALSSNTAYDPATNSWTALTSLPAARFSGAGKLLANGTIVYSGGYNGGFKSNTYIGTFS